MQGKIPDELFDSLQLRTIDISKNKLNGTVPILIEQLKNIENIRFNENQIGGSLPPEIFSLTRIKVLMMQSNKLTGSIPTSVGTLHNLTLLILNHNSLKGQNPLWLQNLTQSETLHLHHNQLTGIAPKFTVTDVTSFIADCGFPNYALPEPLTYHCTMCCNSEGACQEIRPTSNVFKSSMQIVGLTTICMISQLSLRSICKIVFGKGQINLKDVYTNTSVHSFVSAEGIIPKVIYVYIYNSHCLLSTC